MIIDALKVDANFLFQDEMKELDTNDFSIPEIKMVRKYRVLDAHGKKIVDMVLDEEYSRCENEYIELVARGGKYKVKKDDAVEWAKQLDLDNYEEDHDLG